MRVLFIELGQHETQISEAGEINLHKHFKHCTKNPKHENFIPVDTFSLEHLPDDCRDEELYDCVKILADLTVRILVRVTSPNRPDVWPGTNTPYPLHDLRGSNELKTGTGRLWMVSTFTQEQEERRASSITSCPCSKCRHSSNPSKIWGEFYVVTATHVVFDETEAKETSCRLFYNGETCPRVIIDGFDAYFDKALEYDRCWLRCATCDLELVQVVQEKIKSFDTLWEKLQEKFEPSRDEHKLAIVVSHPHGCSKQISVGQWVDKYNVAGDYKESKFTYTTCTCPGSSGAMVYFLGYSGGKYWLHLHFGGLNAELNHSGVGFDVAKNYDNVEEYDLENLSDEAVDDIMNKLLFESD